MRIKIIILINLIILSLILFTGCKEEIRRETIDIKAKIINVDYTPMWMQPVRCGKTTTFITHPAIYNTKLQYEDVSQTINNIDLYKICKDNEGNLIDCKLLIIYYDNETTKSTIIIN